MAIYQTSEQLRNFELSDGTMVDLIKLTLGGGATERPADWKASKTSPAIGTVAYVYAMRSWRRGVVVRTTPTKVRVAITTRSAIDRPTPEGIRVQIVVADTNYVAVAPPAEPVAETLDTTSELAQSLIEADHKEAILEADERRWTLGAIIDVEEMAYAEKAERETASASPMREGEHLVEVDEDHRIPVRETTGSAVVRLLERVHERIRANHPEVPAMVIVTGAGIGNGSNKWGHFRPQGWTANGEQKSRHHEMFMAGETLAKGAKQVLQTMLHESAHALAAVRDVQDTSRQGRWHNQVFRKHAEEMGLEHKSDKADKSHGYSFVTLTEHTIKVYADLLEELDREIHLTVGLPVWLGGDAGEQGGEDMGRAPRTGEGGGSNSGGIKLTCACEEPNIIRASKKVAAKMVVRCEDCESTFRERS